MSTRKPLYLILPIILLLTMACQIGIPAFMNRETVRGSGVTKSEDRSVSGFDRIALSGAGDLHITQGSEEKLTVEADDNLLPYITTEVVSNELRIGFKDTANVIPLKDIRFDLTVKNLNNLSISGAGNVQADALKSSTLGLDISGAGKVDMKGLDIQTLTVKSSGAGTFDLAGIANKQTVTLSGTGNYQAGDLKSQTASIVVSGAGNSTLWVMESLNVQISGLGKVDYYGSATVDQQISGAGTVKNLGDHK